MLLYELNCMWCGVMYRKIRDPENLHLALNNFSGLMADTVFCCEKLKSRASI